MPMNTPDERPSLGRRLSLEAGPQREVAVMKKWLVTAIVTVLGMVGVWAPTHHYHHYDLRVARADMYWSGDMHGSQDMYSPGSV